MRLSRLAAVLVAAVLLAGLASCARAIDGSGSLASDVVTGGPTPTGGSDPSSPSTDPSTDPTTAPTSDSPTPEPPAPSPTANPIRTRERALCVLMRGAISNINNQFNSSRDRDRQIGILRAGATTIHGQLSRSGLALTDGVRRTGTNVYNQLNRLVADAGGGGTPSTKAYNIATQNFQKACNSVS